MAVASPSQFTTPLTIADPATLAEVYAFRAEVWRATLAERKKNFLPESWQDDYDESSLHWIIRDADRRIVAAARQSIHPTIQQVPEAEEYLRYGIAPQGLVAAPARVVVSPSAQGQGLGQLLLVAQDEAAISAGACMAVRQASPDMCRLLNRRGWRIVGPARPDPRFPGIEFQVALKEYPIPIA